MSNGNAGDGSAKGKELVAWKSDAIEEQKVMPQVIYHHTYPEPQAKYKDVVENPKLFMESLGKLHASMGTKFMIPTIGGRELDLHRLFIEVASRGGIEKVIGDRRWKEVTSVFSFPSTATNASFVLRKYYMSLLRHYEQLYFFEAKGWNSPASAFLTTPATSVQPERYGEPIVQPRSNLVASGKQRNNGQSAPSGSSPSANRTVVGVIDGKFENGYFVSVTVGSQKLKGVLFHPLNQSAAHIADFSGMAENSNLKVTRCRRRRKKHNKRDPTHPKPNRSGYNFFFAEQHARLKPLHPGRDREISKMIGDLWNKLTEMEKAVYQERGVKDKERYKSEMVVYRESLVMGQVIRNAVPIQQRPAEPDIVMEDVNMKAEMDEANRNDIESEDTSDFDGKKSDEDSESESSPDVGAAGIESTSLVADTSNEGVGFEFKRGRMQVETGRFAEPSFSQQFSDAQLWK